MLKLLIINFLIILFFNNKNLILKLLMKNFLIKIFMLKIYYI